MHIEHILAAFFMTLSGELFPNEGGFNGWVVCNRSNGHSLLLTSLYGVVIAPSRWERLNGWCDSPVAIKGRIETDDRRRPKRLVRVDSIDALETPVNTWEIEVSDVHVDTASCVVDFVITITNLLEESRVMELERIGHVVVDQSSGHVILGNSL